MTPSQQNIEVTLETQLESVEVAEHLAARVATASGFDEDDIHKIGMAVREGVINAYKYGNREDRKKKIHIRIELEPEKIVIHVLDQGEGFDLSKVPDPLAEGNLLRTSGRGIFLMRAFMDEFAVRRGPSGGTELVMAKQLPHRGSDNGRASRATFK